MPQEVKIIPLSLPLGLGKVNCYLIKTDNGCVLIDTGLDRQRANLEGELVSAGCQPGNLKLILVTHGDSDHSGNAAYLREKYGAKIAVHRGESKVVERGDMILNRKNRPFLETVA
jgi:hydroxyacylglutathione hydrolase